MRILNGASRQAAWSSIAAKYGKRRKGTLHRPPGLIGIELQGKGWFCSTTTHVIPATSTEDGDCLIVPAPCIDRND